jgi:hypothetical protein
MEYRAISDSSSFSLCTNPDFELEANTINLNANVSRECLLSKLTAEQIFSTFTVEVLSTFSLRKHGLKIVKKFSKMMESIVQDRNFMLVRPEIYEQRYQYVRDAINLKRRFIGYLEKDVSAVKQTEGFWKRLQHVIPAIEYTSLFVALGVARFDCEFTIRDMLNVSSKFLKNRILKRTTLRQMTCLFIKVINYNVSPTPSIVTWMEQVKSTQDPSLSFEEFQVETARSRLAVAVAKVTANPKNKNLMQEAMEAVHELGTSEIDWTKGLYYGFTYCKKRVVERAKPAQVFYEVVEGSVKGTLPFVNHYVRINDVNQKFILMLKKCLVLHQWYKYEKQSHKKLDNDPAYMAYPAKLKKQYSKYKQKELEFIRRTVFRRLNQLYLELSNLTNRVNRGVFDRPEVIHLCLHLPKFLLRKWYHDSPIFANPIHRIRDVRLLNAKIHGYETFKALSKEQILALTQEQLNDFMESASELATHSLMIMYPDLFYRLVKYKLLDRGRLLDALEFVSGLTILNWQNFELLTNLLLMSKAVKHEPRFLAIHSVLIGKVAETDIQKLYPS